MTSLVHWFHFCLQNMAEVLERCGSQNWSERKDGLLGLQSALRSRHQLTRVEIRKATEIFTRMFSDPHVKVLLVFAIYFYSTSRPITATSTPLNNFSGQSTPDLTNISHSEFNTDHKFVGYGHLFSYSRTE